MQPYYGGNMQYQGTINKAITVGEAKSDLEISLLLGKRLNPEAWPWEIAEDFYEEHCFNSLGKHLSLIHI